MNDLPSFCNSLFNKIFFKHSYKVQRFVTHVFKAQRKFEMHTVRMLVQRFTKTW